MEDLESVVRQWNGYLSVAIHASDREAHSVFVKGEDYGKRTNMKQVFFHVVYKNAVSTSVELISGCENSLIVSLCFSHLQRR